MSVTKLFITVAVLLAISRDQVYSGDDQWFFTGNEIAVAYRFQQHYGARLRYPLKPEACLYGQEEFTASFQGKQFPAPCRFVTETIRHLREALESKAARYLFPLDLDYGRLGVPLELWKAKYSKLSGEEQLRALLQEHSLVALYHTAGHLEPEANTKSTAGENWQKRSLLGFYNGQPMKTFSRRSSEALASVPEGYTWLNDFKILAHYLGELQLVIDGAVVTFDISFDDDRAAEVSPKPVNVSVTSR
ncbi:MAG: hypothetical protein HYY82_13950 [Deltaproteobacteria bacterium]|nr:hypothetical protein [Deltaproteobacteria bacterium]